MAVKESNQRWCSDGVEFRCDKGEKLRVTFAQDCCDCEVFQQRLVTESSTAVVVILQQQQTGSPAFLKPPLLQQSARIDASVRGSVQAADH
ncbi:hypothetical protein DWG96_19970 [Escherichia coli]|nr:hypothetical protein [Escherichia coli]